MHRLCREETNSKREETKGVKKPAKHSKKEETKGVKKPAKHSKKEETKGFKTPAKKKLKASRHQPRRNLYSKKPKKKPTARNLRRNQQQEI